MGKRKGAGIRGATKAEGEKSIFLFIITNVINIESQFKDHTGKWECYQT